jgi:hypothetical protein
MNALKSKKILQNVSTFAEQICVEIMLVFGRCSLLTSADILATLTEGFRGISQSLQKNSRISP